MALTQVGGSGIGSATATGTFAVTGVHTVGNNAIYTSDGGAVTQNLVQGSLKAWHRADGDASTVAFNDSYNFASITDNGTGNYTSTFTNAMNNDDFSVGLTSAMGGGNGGFNGTSTINTTSVRTNSYTNTGSFRDVDPIFLMIAGDLA